MKNTNKNTININNNKSDSENSNNFNKYFTSIGAEINNSFNDPYSDRFTNITSYPSYNMHVIYLLLNLCFNSNIKFKYKLYSNYIKIVYIII